MIMVACRFERDIAHGQRCLTFSTPSCALNDVIVPLEWVRSSFSTSGHLRIV